MGGPKSMNPNDLWQGAVLQCVEAATLGMPFEVWKTRMGRFRNEGTIEAFVNVYKRAGVTGFWQGVGPKMIESASKGAVLLASKEAILGSLEKGGVSPTVAGIAAGAGGGICQVSVMGPCTFVVTAVVTGSKDVNVGTLLSRTLKEKGIKGLYPGGSALAFRQASNWASRQGLTEFVRGQMKVRLYGDDKAKLTKGQEALCGIMGGTLATWNQPFEVARIEMQSAAAEGRPKLSLPKTLTTIVGEHGPLALFKGIVPRIGLGIWQTLFMVTGAKILKESMK